MYVAGSSLSLSVARGKESRFDRVISFLLHEKLEKKKKGRDGGEIYTPAINHAYSSKYSTAAVGPRCYK